MYLALDFLYVKDIRATTFAILTVIDMATLFHLAVRTTQTGAAEVFKAFRNLWLNWAGPPEQVILDPDPQFLGAFRAQCERLNICRSSLAVGPEGETQCCLQGVS